MFNRDGIKSTTYGAPVQILANVELQYSMGCRVPQSLGTDVTGVGKIAKAGTPVFIDLGSREAVPVAAPVLLQRQLPVLLLQVLVSLMLKL